uniref:Uncharacterized protein n=1 Tax=Arundo donax TaxID=35708 RepID=A0A0A8YR10_ARUDO
MAVVRLFLEFPTLLT